MTRIAEALIGWAIMPIAIAAFYLAVGIAITLRLLDPYR